MAVLASWSHNSSLWTVPSMVISKLLDYTYPNSKLLVNSDHLLAYVRLVIDKLYTFIILLVYTFNITRKEIHNRQVKMEQMMFLNVFPIMIASD